MIFLKEVLNAAKSSPLTCWGESRVSCALVICFLVLSIRVLLDNILCINITSLHSYTMKHDSSKLTEYILKKTAIYAVGNPSNQDPWNVATPVFRPLQKVPKHAFYPWNVATPLIRTLSLVPRVAGLEGFHCICSIQSNPPPEKLAR